LNAEAARAGESWRVVRLDAVDSTNDEARRRALAGDPGRLWIVADRQSAGRGRRGRAWISCAGNLHASALLIDPCPTAISPQLGFVAGVALARAAEEAGAEARLKWPNDLVAGGGKCAGLLVEGVTLAGGGFGCVIGVGVNCASAPEGVGYPVGVLADRFGFPISHEGMLTRLVAQFDRALAEWRAGAGFAFIRDAWLARAAGLNGHIRVETAGRGQREGVFEGLDPGGRLLFRGEGGLETIEAGDIWISAAPRDASTARGSAALPREGRD